jgi:hypothetical protein
VIGRCGPATKWNPEEFGLGGQLIFVFWKWFLEVLIFVNLIDVRIILEFTKWSWS